MQNMSFDIDMIENNMVPSDKERLKFLVVQMKENEELYFHKFFSSTLPEKRDIYFDLIVLVRFLDYKLRHDED